MIGGRTKAVVLSVIALAASVTVLIAATFALFSDSSKTTNHLEAGTLEAGLRQINVSGVALQEDGTLAEFSTATDIDLTTDDKRLFALENVCPGVEQTVRLKISNEGTTAFTYSVKVAELTAEGTASRSLASELKVVVKDGAGAVKGEFALDKYADAANDIALGSLLVGQEAEFTVTVLFDRETGSNAAQTGDVTFDLTVTATQSVN